MIIYRQAHDRWGKEAINSKYDRGSVPIENVMLLYEPKVMNSMRRDKLRNELTIE